MEAPQHGLHPLHDEPLRERLSDVVIGPHFEAKELVDLLVLGSQEDDRHVRLLADATQQLHSIHARHLDVEDAEVGRLLGQGLERGCAVGVCPHLIALCLEGHPERG